MIRSISEPTGSTLDCSNEPCCRVPNPLPLDRGCPLSRRQRRRIPGRGSRRDPEALGIDEIGQLDGRLLLETFATSLELVSQDNRPAAPMMEKFVASGGIAHRRSAIGQRGRSHDELAAGILGEITRPGVIDRAGRVLDLEKAAVL